MSTQPPKFYKNPSTATILSFFFMGLGQIYNGQIGKGTPILWIWGMVDANNSAKKINEKIATE